MEPLETLVEGTPQDRFEYVVTVLIMVTTLLGVIVAFLQMHASVQEDRAARDAEVLAIQLMAEIVQNGHRSDYEAGLFYDFVSLSQLNLARQFGRVSAWQQGEAELMSVYEHEAGRLEAMVEAVRRHSMLLGDRRYAPQDDSSAPNLQLWADESMAPVLELLEQQNASVEVRDAWGVKANEYVAIITLLAVSLFLFGLSLVTKTRVRLVFVGVGSAILVVSAIWSLVTALA